MSILGLIALVLVLFLLSGSIVQQEGLESCGPSPADNSAAIKTLQVDVQQLQARLNSMAHQQGQIVNERLKSAKGHR